MVAVGLTEKLNVPFPVPVVVAPLLNTSVHAPVAVTLPDTVADAPAQIAVLALVIAAVGRVLRVTVAFPVNPEEMAVQFASTKEVMEYVVVAEGVTEMLNVPVPVPVAVAPLLRVSVQAPVAVTLPETVELTPAQMVVPLLVMAAVGRWLMVTRVLPVMLLAEAEQLASTKDTIV